MPSTTVNDVKVMNLPVRTTYYRGRYYRTETTVCIAPSGFRSFNRSTFFGHNTGLRWWDTSEERHDFMSWRYDSSRCTFEPPF